MKVKEAMIFKAELHSLRAYQSLDLLSTYFQRIFQYLRRCLHRTKKRTRRKSDILKSLILSTNINLCITIEVLKIKQELFVISFFVTSFQNLANDAAVKR